MRKISFKIYITLVFIFILSNGYTQSIYKGLEYGMSKSEAASEFKKSKKTYTTVDIGNNFLYQIYKQNFVFDNNELVGVLFTPKGSLFGQSYNEAKNYLIHTRSFFEQLGYETFLENEWWNAPLNYTNSNSKWGLVLNKKDKSTIVQMYPISYELSGKAVYLVKLMIWNYDTWIGYYNKEKGVQKEKADKSGF